MNRKRQLTFVLLGIILILPLINTGCFKRGEDDPFLSIYTRKARMVGTWKYAEMNSEITKSAIGNNSRVITTTVNGPSWRQNIVIDGTDSVINLAGRVNEGISYVRFEKTGQFKQSYAYEYTVSETIGDDEGERRIRTVITESSEGTWNFLGRVENDYKNKERITLNYSSKTSTLRIEETIIRDDDGGPIPTPEIKEDTRTSQTFANGELSEIWTLIRLSKKEIVMEQDVNNNTIDAKGDITASERGIRKQTLGK
jgi:hypothetical protein